MRNVTAIVGAGFSGTILAVNLLRRSGAKPADIVLIERAPAMHRGVAYAESDFPYLLNVPAARLSADSADAQEFLRFARTRLPDTGPEDFLPRSLYGEYLGDLLKQAEIGAAAHVRLLRVHDEVRDIAAHGGAFDISFAGREPLRANRVVLAVGNPPASNLPWLGSLSAHEAVSADPWLLPRHLDERHSVLIVGNGLTMADVALALSWNPARVPTLHTISRRGLLPQVQTSFHPNPACGKGEDLLAGADSMRSLLKAGRRLAHQVQQAGGDWREAVTLIRGMAPQIWQNLALKERARFVRHVQVYWDTHRHRMPPQLAERLAGLKQSGKLQINAGRVQGVSEQAGRLRVDWLPRGSQLSRSLLVDLIVNATGPDYMLARTREPLLRSLLAKGLIVADTLDLGIVTDAACACFDANGEAAANLYYLGPMLRARYWEATAVTELRDHAERLAARLTA